MAVYKLIQDSDTYDSLLVDRETDRLFDEFGKSQGQTWRPLHVEVYSVGQAGDFPSLRRDVPIFSERAWQTLRPLIESSVEALPLAGGIGRRRRSDAIVVHGITIHSIAPDEFAVEGYLDVHRNH